MFVTLRAGTASYAKIECESVTIGSQNVVLNDGRIILAHEQYPILISFKEVDGDYAKQVEDEDVEEYLEERALDEELD